MTHVVLQLSTHAQSSQRLAEHWRALACTSAPVARSSETETDGGGGGCDGATRDRATRQSNAREDTHAREDGIRGRLIDITRTHTREFVVMPPRATKKTKTNASGDGGGSRGAHAGKAVDYGTYDDDV